MRNVAVKFIQQPEIESRRSCTILLSRYTQQNAKIMFNQQCHQAFGLQLLIDKIDYVSHSICYFYTENIADSTLPEFYVYLESKLDEEIGKICSHNNFQDFPHFERVFKKNNLSIVEITFTK